MQLRKLQKGKGEAMLIKAGVDISRLNREVRRTMTPMNAWVESVGEEMVIISTYEGNHEAGSLHYCDDAYDIRRPDRADSGEKERVKKLLGPDFDVVFYAECIHIEFDSPRVPFQNGR